jgi:hypothetical protein
MSLISDNHYTFCEQHLAAFFEAVGLKADDTEGLLVAHGDKFYQYRCDFEAAGLHFYHGVAIGLLVYFPPFRAEVYGSNGFIKRPIPEWVVENKRRFLQYLPPLAVA